MGESSRIREVAAVFLRMGFTAFGGPTAHLALLENEVVHRRGWIDRQHFLDLAGAVNFIPGPNSTELAIHLGYLRAGWRGLIVAGVCFIVPAMLIVLPLAWLYVMYGHRPDFQGPLAAIVACMIAIIVVAMIRFARTALRDRFAGVLASIALAGGVGLPLLHVPQSELIVLAIGAAAGAVWYGRPKDAAPAQSGSAGRLAIAPVALLAAGAASTVLGKMTTMLLLFLKVGATLFGTGYVLVSYLRGDFVERLAWLTSDELSHAIAVGQVTPGPLLTTATFIGYVLGFRWSGHRMALAGGVGATAAIFLPSFIFVAILGPLWSRLRNNPKARGALDGMNAAVVALILVAAIGLTQGAVAGKHASSLILSAAVFAVTLAALLRWKTLNSTWLIAGSAAVGLVATWAGVA